MRKYILTVLITAVFSIVLYATPHNIAPWARATASSTLDVSFLPQNITDGIIGVDGKGEWASNSGQTSWGAVEYPWVKLEWAKPQNINCIILYDRPGRGSHNAGGILHFSDGSQIAVDQIPINGFARKITFPVKNTKWVKFETTDGDGYQIGLSEIEVYPALSDYVDYVSKVDPYIESARGRYFFFVTGSRPFGMISSAPLTRNKNQYGGGYNYNSLEVLGFPQVHDWMISGVSFMPTTGKLKPYLGEQEWKSAFSHDDEIVQPGYHRLLLRDYGIWVEQTATDRVSYYKLRFTKDDTANLLLNLGGFLGTTTMNDSRVERISDTEIVGSVNTTGRFWGGPDNVRIFFVMKVDQPFSRLDGWSDSEMFENINSHKGENTITARNEGESYYDAPNSGVSLHYEVKAGQEMQVKFAISFTSIDNARKNLESDNFEWDFDTIKADALQDWNQWLGRIDVKGGTDQQQTKFYTDLWHVLLGRHKIDDVSGDYPDYTQGERVGNATKNAQLIVRSLPKNSDGSTKFHMYNSDAFWLTQWNLNILWGLAWPEIQDEFAASLVQYSENGGLLPRGPNVGGYSYIMTSCPATNLITSAFQKNILTKVDHETAYFHMVQNHKPGGMLGPKDEISFYIKNGYYPSNAGITIEAAFQDWALSQMAAKLNKKKDAKYYLNRSLGWRKLFNKDQNLVFPKNKNGEWIETDPLSNNGWIEANAWQGTFGLSHDLEALAEMMGGYEVLSEQLNFAFEQSEDQNFISGYGNGYISYANQPGCSNAHVFNMAKKPWLSQYWVRQVGSKAFGTTTPASGYGGHDEDQGQMGGVSALMAIGLFSVQGTSSINPAYEITSPVFDEITIRLNQNYYSGEEFKIRTYNNSSDHYYIQKAQLNGNTHSSVKLDHSDFEKGGLLEIWLDKMPNKNWGVDD